MKLRFLSLFSGIEAASCAWVKLGWECVGIAEIEPFPCAVLKHYYPDVPNLGNISNITEEQIKALGHIDLVVGGFPCQDLSLAGKRKGLKNEDGTATRSGLFFDATRLVQWTNARWLVLENVTGMFSSNGGNDFAEVVGELIGCKFNVPPNGWENTGIAQSNRGIVEWATLDAQFFGLAQRRKRCFLIRDFGSWADRKPIFLDPQGLSRNPAPCRSQGSQVANCIAASPASYGSHAKIEQGRGNVIIEKKTELQWPAEIASTLNASFSSKQGLEDQHIYNGASWFVPEYVGTLTATDPTTCSISLVHGGYYIAQPPSSAFSIREDAIAGNFHATEIEVSNTVNSLQPSPQSHHAQTFVTHPVALGGDVAGTLDAHYFKGPGSAAFGEREYVAHPQQMRIRRLTPRECERLQGFVDDYTNIPWNKKQTAPDGLRYKALGNSMAVPVMEWIGRRIETVLKESQ